MKGWNLSTRKKMRLLLWMCMVNQKWQLRSLSLRSARILRFWEAASSLGLRLFHLFLNHFQFRCTWTKTMQSFHLSFFPSYVHASEFYRIWSCSYPGSNWCFTWLTQWIDGVLSKGEQLEFFRDEFRCPVYVKDVVTVILSLTNKWLSGNIHNELQLSLLNWSKHNSNTLN